MKLGYRAGLMSRESLDLDDTSIVGFPSDIKNLVNMHGPGTYYRALNDSIFWCSNSTSVMNLTI